MQMENESMRYCFYNLDGDAETPVYAGIADIADLGPLLINLVGVGHPYWLFEDENIGMQILLADAIAIDFTDAPVCSSNIVTNRQLAATCLANPPTGKITIV